ncbi:hypothetical protein ACJ72_04770 [Emergomyces africanus]|uniref:Uncharacterized protein n=1 Tax=Emergomyces africanus TaxID=1955775 RepID=A0A1B7NVV3_9EURO|nr:hypothetical protein ACJ72_04770 [Emergomyces africanus]
MLYSAACAWLIQLLSAVGAAAAPPSTFFTIRASLGSAHYGWLTERQLPAMETPMVVVTLDEPSASLVSFASFGYMLMYSHTKPEFWYLNLDNSTAVNNVYDVTLTHQPGITWLHEGEEQRLVWNGAQNNTEGWTLCQGGVTGIQWRLVYNDTTPAAGLSSGSGYMQHCMPTTLVLMPYD